jgi:hypothetical protein
VAEGREPAAQDAVHALSTDHRLVRPGQLGRVQHERMRLRPAHSAVRADQLLERGHLTGLVPVGAVEHQVGAMREGVGAAQVLGGVRSEGGKRIRSLDPAGVEVVHAVLADRERAVARGAHHHEGDAGVVAQLRQQPGMQLRQAFQRDASGLPRK